MWCRWCSELIENNLDNDFCCEDHKNFWYGNKKPWWEATN